MEGRAPDGPVSARRGAAPLVAAAAALLCLPMSGVAQDTEWNRYTLEDYGLTPEEVNAAFARYRNFITDLGIRSSRS